MTKNFKELRDGLAGIVGENRLAEARREADEELDRPIFSKRFLTTGLVIAIMLNVAIIYLARNGSPVLIVNLVAIGICCAGLWFVRRYL